MYSRLTPLLPLLLAASLTAAEAWPWGFGRGEHPDQPAAYDHVLHVAPGATDGDGSAERPFGDLSQAVEQAERLMQAWEFRPRDVEGVAQVPMWLRLEYARGVTLFSIAPDVDGEPGDFEMVGDSCRIALDGGYQLGLLVTNDQGWPKELAQASVDRISLNGAPVTGWRGYRFSRGQGQFEASGDGLRIGGCGDVMWSDQWDDEGYFVGVSHSGEAELTVRISELVPSPATGKVTVGLVIRERAERHGRTAMLNLEGEKAGDGLAMRLRLHHRRQVKTTSPSVRIAMAPGVYYTGEYWDPTDLPVRDDTARDAFFRIGAADGAPVGSVVLSGCEPLAPWVAETWRQEGDRIYAHPWTGGERGKATKKPEQAVLALTPLGGDRLDRVHLEAVKLEAWTGKAGTFCLDEAAGTVRMALPDGWDAASFLRGGVADGDATNDALVEVANRADAGLLVNCLPGLSPNRATGNNVVLSNLVLEHFHHALRIGAYSDPLHQNENWLLEDLAIQHNTGDSTLRFLRHFTIRNLQVRDNRGEGLKTILAEGEMIDPVFEGNGGSAWLPADRNLHVLRGRFVRNAGVGIRMDHMFTGMLLEDCLIAENDGIGVVLETATGPMEFRGCTFRNNIKRGVKEGNRAQVDLATALNATFAGCEFIYDRGAAISLYGRERAHMPTDDKYNQPWTLDLPPNSLDYRQWSRFTLWKGNVDHEYLSQPSGQQPGSFNPNLIVQGCTFRASGSGSLFYDEQWWDRDAAFDQTIQRELIAYNNEYHLADRADPFALRAVPGYNNAQLVTGGWDAWLANGNARAMYWDPAYRFEAGSAFNAAAPRDFTPAPRPLATPGTDASGKVVDGTIRYEVERLPFTVGGEVELRQDAAASGGAYHKLLVDQIGDHGEWIEYRLAVPETGRYHVVVDYLRNAGPFEYLGYAQLSIDPQGRPSIYRMDQDPNPFGPGHRYWDQSGLTRGFASVHLGEFELSAGEHRFRFDPAWKDGYISGDYDITVDAITLHRELPAWPAVDAAGTRPGLMRRTYQTEAADWFTRIPDFGPMVPTGSGVVQTIGMDGAPDRFGAVYEGFITVPEDAVYTFTTATKGQSKLFIDDVLVIDCDGPHGYYDQVADERDPWYKYGRVPLAAGAHRLRLEFQVALGKPRLDLLWERDGVAREAVPAAVLSHRP